MKTKTIIAFMFILLGIVVIAYSGITFSTPGKPVNFLGIHIETTVSHFIPPVVGVVGIAIGVVLLLLNRKSA